MMSLKAKGLMITIINNPNIKISALGIANHVKEGKSAIGAGLKELRKLGYLKMTRTKIGSVFGTFYEITEKGKDWYIKQGLSYTENRTHHKPKIGIPYSDKEINSTIYKYINHSISDGQAVGEKESEGKVGYSFFKSGSEDEFVSQLREAKEVAIKEKKKEYNEAKKKKKAADEFIKEDNRKNKSPKDYNCAEVSFTFQERITAIWGSIDITLSHAQLNGSLKAARDKNKTDGEIELAMMELFFDSIVETKIDGNLLWNMFIKRFATLATQAKNNMSSASDLEKAKEQSAKSMRMFDV